MILHIVCYLILSYYVSRVTTPRVSSNDRLHLINSRIMVQQLIFSTHTIIKQIIIWTGACSWCAQLRTTAH